MSNYLSSNKLDKITRWLSDIQNAPILLHPLHSVVHEDFGEFPPDIAELRIPKFEFEYKQATRRRQIPKWKSEYLDIFRNELSVNGNPAHICYDKAGALSESFRPELNTVESMMSLPNPEANELVTESRSVLTGEFVRVLHIRNSFRAEQQMLATLLCHHGLSTETRIFCDVRQGECLYGCEKAQRAADYIRSYAGQMNLTIDFASLLSAFSYPEVMEGEGDSSSWSLSCSDSATGVSIGTTAGPSSGKLDSPRKQAISEVDFKNWKDGWVFQASHRAVRHPGIL